MLQNGRFEWIFKYDPSNLEDEEFKPFKLDKSYTYMDERIVYITYNHFYTKMYAGTEEGGIIFLPVEAESFDVEEEE